MEGLVLMVYVPGMLPIVSKRLGKACFRAMMSWAAAVGGVAASAWLGLWGLGVDLSQVPLGEGIFGFMLLIGFLNHTIFAVFLVLQGGVML